MTRRSRVGCELATSSTEVHNVMASHRTLYEILLLCFYLHFAPHVKGPPCNVGSRLDRVFESIVIPSRIVDTPISYSRYKRERHKCGAHARAPCHALRHEIRTTARARPGRLRARTHDTFTPSRIACVTKRVIDRTQNTQWGTVRVRFKGASEKRTSSFGFITS